MHYLENIAEYVKEDVLKDEKLCIDTIIGINNYCQVRGYTNLSFNCNVIESVSLDDLNQYSVKNGYDKYIYILSDYCYSDKYHILGLLLGENNQEKMSYYHVEDGVVYKDYVMKSDIHAMPFSDRAFTQGANVTGSTLRFEKTEDISKKLADATYIKSGDIKLDIESITEYEKSYDIKLIGEVSPWIMKKLEFPAVIEIE